MKKSRMTTFSKARIENVDGEFYIIESGKKDAPDKEFSLNDELNQWIGVDDITLTIKQNTEIDPDMEMGD